jgi:uncharacterized protein YjiK
VAFSPDGRFVVTGSLDNTAKLWNIATGTEIRTFKGHSNTVLAVAFSPDSRFVVTGSSDNTAKLWNIATGTEIRTFKGHSDSVLSVAFSPDSRFVVTGGLYDAAKLWETATGKKIRDFAGHAGSVEAAAFSPDGRFVVTDSSHYTAKLWDVATQTEIRTFKGHSSSVKSVAFSPDGRFAVTGSFDNTAKLWEVTTGKEIRSFVGHTESVEAVAFSPDGRFVVTGAWDATIKIWQTETGALLCTLYSLRGEDWLVVTPDGRFDGSEDGMKLIHYVHNNESIPLDSFFDKFYTSGLLAQVVSGESSKLPKPDVEISSAIARATPLVKIISPKDGQSFMDDRVEIEVETTDQGGGINEVVLYQNGKAVTAKKDKKNLKGKMTTVFDVTLAPGSNEFRAIAYNNDRTKSPEQNQGLASYELKSVQPEARLHVLAIGINEYKNSRLNLKQAKRDAEEFIKTAEERGRKLFAEVIKYPVFDADATREKIESAFSRITADARPQDVFVVFYSGHGTTSEGSKGKPADFHFALTEVTQLYGDDAMLESKGLSGRRLGELMGKVKATKQVIVVDACEAGGLVKTAMLRGGAEQKAIKQLAISSGLAILASTATDQFATEFEELGHGVFTYALLKGLAGEADGSPKDGLITVNEIAAFVYSRVPDLTKQYRGSPQYPTRFMGGHDFPLALRGN